MKSLFKNRAVRLSFLSLFISGALMAQSSKSLTDPEIASVAVVANQIDIKAAQLAQQKSTDPSILAFAKTMINDHQSVIDQASALVKKLGVTPKDNYLSKQLSAQAEKTAKILSSKSGKEFDKAYVNNEVAYHKAVIAAVNDKLIPETQNKELKELLQSVAPVLKAHLEHAQMVQQKFSVK
jgi:putative membrane protein